MGTYQPFHDLPAAQFQGLVDDIAKRGVLLPIIVDEDGQVIDGHQRRRAAAEAGVECPRVVVVGLSEDEKKTLSLTLNLFRRHLCGTERSKALTQLANLGLSTRRMADILGISKSQVHRDLSELSHTGQLNDRPETITDSLGREQPTTKTRDVSHMGHVSPPAGVDPETDEIVGGEPSLTLTSEGESQVPPVDAPGDSPSVPHAETSDPEAGYRERASRVHATTRSSLLALDPERIALVTEPKDRGAWRAFASDLTAWADALTAALDEGSHLRSVK